MTTTLCTCKWEVEANAVEGGEIGVSVSYWVFFFAWEWVADKL